MSQAATRRPVLASQIGLASFYVTNLENGREVYVRVIDRGPARKYQAEGIIIDLSTRAARVLGFLHDGRARVRVDVLEWGQ